MSVKYPDITVDLSDVDGNAFSVIDAVVKELRANNIPATDIEQFRKDATSGDYDDLLRTVMTWVNVDFLEEEDYDDDDDDWDGFYGEEDDDDEEDDDWADED